MPLSASERVLEGAKSAHATKRRTVATEIVTRPRETENLALRSGADVGGVVADINPPLGHHEHEV